jgi:threonyl-tRNA synthetase
MHNSPSYIRRSASNLLSRSILSLFPKTKIIQFGDTRTGFYCDILVSHPIDDQALRLIEEELQRSIQEDLEIEALEMMRENAANLLQHQGQEYQAENLLQHPSNIVTMMRIGDYYGFCEAPYPSHTRELGVVKLLSASKSDHKTRIEGIVFPDRKILKKFLRQLSAHRSHEEIGSEASLFVVDQGECVWLPQGEWVRELLIDWWKTSHRIQGYGCFHATNRQLSPPFSDSDKQLAQIIECKRESKKYGEDGLRELSLQVEDQAWALCDENKILETLISRLQFIKKTVNMVPIDCKWIFYRVNPEGPGNQKYRDLSVKYFEEALNQSEIEAEISQHESNRNVFVEILYTDSLGREWPGPKVELLDPSKFGVNQEGCSFVVRSSIYGSLECFIALLLEATGGDLPIWLAPEQVRILPVKESDANSSQQMVDELRSRGFRATCDHSSAPLSEKVFTARMKKVPYLIILGKNERENGTVAVNRYSDGNVNEVMIFEQFLERLQEEVNQARFPNKG